MNSQKELLCPQATHTVQCASSIIISNGSCGIIVSFTVCCDFDAEGEVKFFGWLDKTLMIKPAENGFTTPVGRAPSPIRNRNLWIYNSVENLQSKSTKCKCTLRQCLVSYKHVSMTTKTRAQIPMTTWMKSSYRKVALPFLMVSLCWKEAATKDKHFDDTWIEQNQQPSKINYLLLRTDSSTLTPPDPIT